MKKIFFSLIIVLIFSSFLIAKDDYKASMIQQASEDVLIAMSEKVDSLQVVTYKAFSGNDDQQFQKTLISKLTQSKKFKILAQEDLKELFDYNLTFSEPIFKEKIKAGQFSTPYLIINGLSNYHKSSRFFKQTHYLKIEVKVSNISNGTVLLLFNKEYKEKEQINAIYILLFALVMIILARMINQYFKGYHSKIIYISALLIIILSIIWYFI